MPELPEVEVVRRSLNTFICGLKIKKVDIFNNKLRYTISSSLKKALKNKKIISVKRRAKFLLINIQKNNTLLIHLGMTGKIFILNKSDKTTIKTSFYYSPKILKKHNHLGIKFNKYIELIYNDVRKFGFIKLLKTDQSNNCVNLISLGPEPLNNKFNFHYMKTRIIKCNKNIKNFLMDQKHVSGLGNIYVNEILFSSGVRPTKKIKKLTDVEIHKIIKFSKKIISKAIVLGGSSIKDFSSSSGKKGSFQQYFSVYGKKDDNCPKVRCAGKIKKIVIANRASFFCNKCQK